MCHLLFSSSFGVASVSDQKKTRALTEHVIGHVNLDVPLAVEDHLTLYTLVRFLLKSKPETQSEVFTLSTPEPVRSEILFYRVPTIRLCKGYLTKEGSDGVMACMIT